MKKATIVLEEDEIKEKTEMWNNALVIYTTGELPSYTFMSNYISKSWNEVRTKELYLNDEGFCIAKFLDIHDRN